MKRNLAAMTALAGSLVLTAAVGASAAPNLDFKSSLGTGSGLVELARDGGGRGGGGGGGMRGGGGGGGGWKGGGGGGGVAMGNRGGGGSAGRMSGRSYGGNYGLKGGGSGGFKSGRGSGRYANKGWDGGGKKWDGGKNWNRDHRGYRYGKNYRRFYGPDIFVGSGYGYDCGWLARRAQVTGSPYWWQRYQECLYL